jgi:hypothetical protein
VFNNDGREIPIVHRIIKVHQRADNNSNLDILTKVRLARSWLLWCCDACSWWLLPLLLALALQLMTRQPLLQILLGSAASPLFRHTCHLLALAPLPSPALQGDNRKTNRGDDRSLYPKGQLWLNRGHIMGKVVG